VRPDDQLIGAQVDADTSDADEDAYQVTDSARTTVTCGGANMLQHAQAGDPYEIDTHDVDPGDVPAPDTGLTCHGAKYARQIIHARGLEGKVHWDPFFQIPESPAFWYRNTLCLSGSTGSITTTPSSSRSSSG